MVRETAAVTEAMVKARAPVVPRLARRPVARLVRVLPRRTVASAVPVILVGVATVVGRADLVVADADR